MVFEVPDPKDVRAKISSRQIFSVDRFFLLQSDNELLVWKMQKKVGVTDFVSEIKRVENYPNFKKSVRVIQPGI